MNKIAALTDAGIIAVVRAPSAAAAVRTVEALIAGGIRGIEITYTTPDAREAVAQIAAEHAGNVVLGAGTITKPEQAAEAVSAGATFLVSPGVVKDVARAMIATGAGVLLGALTPTEVMVATALGADAIKVFPGALGGPAYLRSLLGPFPDASFIPTGGVNVDNVRHWFAAGAVAVGAGGELCPAAAIAAGDWGLITRNAESFATALRESRG